MCLISRRMASPEHFGLAVKGYTHSTAPNRRFPDLITQRLIKAALGRRAHSVPSGRTEVSGRPLYRERRRCGKVERQLRKSAAALLLESRIGQRFDAIVTGASDRGTWVRLLEPPVEGKMVTGERGLDVGDSVQSGTREHGRRTRVHRLRQSRIVRESPSI